jgi:hypothetical protein
MKRRVIVVDGPFAFRMKRVEAARASRLGLEVLSLPLLAARLADGFRRFQGTTRWSVATSGWS